MICFRVDSGWAIGTGHLMRCLSLADAFRARGLACVFLSRDHEGSAAGLVASRGHRVQSLGPAVAADPKNHATWIGSDMMWDAADTAAAIYNLSGNAGARILFVDHYGISAPWERALRASCHVLAVLDDMNDRPHDCDLLVDQNLGKTARFYKGLIPEHALVLAGADFAPIRPEFAEERPGSLARRMDGETQRRIFVAYGGIDADDSSSLTVAAIEALRERSEFADLAADVVISSRAPHIDALRRRISAAGPHICLYVDTPAVARLMSHSLVACGGGGVTALERCVVGLPTLMLIQASNQEQMGNSIELSGAGRVIGRSSEVALAEIREALAELLADPAGLTKMSTAAAALCDGHGLERIVTACLDKTRSASAGNLN